MAVDKHNVRGGTDVVFADGVTRTVRPLSIKQLRKFVKIIDELGNTAGDATSMTEEEIDTMVDAAAIILEKVDAKLASDREALEDVVDIVTFNDIMGIAMGAADPKE